MISESLVYFILLTGCGSRKDISEKIEIEPSNANNIVVLSDDKVDFYKLDFPNAQHFRVQNISPDLLSDLDKGNDVYYDVLDVNNNVIGYVRDFLGPVSNEEDCACNPLSLTLTYNPDYSLRNILSVNPLQKYGHQELTEEEHKQMVGIAKNPSEEILQLTAPQEMIDGTTGATNLIYKDKVVDRAGYSSWRISHLSMNTSQIIQGAPIRRDIDKIQPMLNDAKSISQQMNTIVEFLPTAESDYVKQRVLYMLEELYLQRLLDGGEIEPTIEELFLNSGLGSFQEAELLTSMCRKFVAHKIALSFVSSCIETLEKNQHYSNFASSVLITKGLMLMEQDKKEEAIQYLEEGISLGETSPEFKLKMVTLYREDNRNEDACRMLEKIYIDSPKWNDIESDLNTCGDIHQIKERLDQTRKSILLSEKVAEPKSVSILNLLDENNVRQKIDVSNSDKIYVIVFFATWCGHCQNKMPQLVDFYNQLQESDLKDTVDFVPIRTAISRENYSIDTFKEIYNIPFPVMTDEGMVLDLFANEQGVRAAFPLLAVTNNKGEVIYFLSSGNYKNTVEDLFWILNSL